MKGSYSVGGSNEVLDLYGEQCSFDGDDTPKHLRKKGLWPINRFVKTKRAFKQGRTVGVGAWNNKPVSPPQNPTPRVLITPVITSVSPINHAEVISKLANEWRQTDLSIGMYLSPEGRESAEMVGDSLLRIANSARSLKRGDFGGFVRGLHHLPRHARREAHDKFKQGDISGSFLSAHLGWSPLIQDIYNLSDNIKPYDLPGNRITAQKKIKRNEIAFRTNPVFGFESNVTTNKQQLRYTLDVTREPTFAQRFGLDNPFLIAWELKPLSFVWDYFLPIGATIDSLGFLSQVRGKGFIKEYSQLTYDLRIPKGTIYNTFIWAKTRDEISGYYSSSSFKRTPWTPSLSDPFRSFSVTVPSSLMRVSTMAALLHQRLIGLRR